MAVESCSFLPNEYSVVEMSATATTGISFANFLLISKFLPLLAQELFALLGAGKLFLASGLSESEKDFLLKGNRH